MCLPPPCAPISPVPAHATGLARAGAESAAFATGRHAVAVRQRFNHSFNNQAEGVDMLKWALFFAVIAVIAGLLGFTGIAAGAATIAKFLFVLFLIVCVVFLVLGFVVTKKIVD
jgi:uncharacterized membrane protein YtjA (UPF0391 family)